MLNQSDQVLFRRLSDRCNCQHSCRRCDSCRNQEVLDWQRCYIL